MKFILVKSEARTRVHLVLICFGGGYSHMVTIVSSGTGVVVSIYQGMIIQLDIVLSELTRKIFERIEKVFWGKSGARTTL